MVIALKRWIFVPHVTRFCLLVDVGLRSRSVENALRIFYTFNRHEDKRLFAFLTELEGLFQSFPFREFAGMSQSGMNIRGQVPV